jgi:hypothetical protein
MSSDADHSRVHLNTHFAAGGGAWAEPDPLAVEHDALLRSVLANQGITQADLEAGNVFNVLCLWLRSCPPAVLPHTINSSDIFINISLYR